MPFLEGIVVAKSRKCNGYCLVIYSLELKKFCRIISKFQRKDHELNEDECQTNKNEIIRLLDKVKIPVICDEPAKELYQKENYVLQDRVKIEKTGSIDINEFVETYLKEDLNKSPYILNNDINTLDLQEAQQTDVSFMLAEISELKFSGKKDKIRCNFKYNNILYDFPVTISKTKEDDCIMFPDGKTFDFALVGFSFAPPFKKNKEDDTELCYKLMVSFLAYKRNNRYLLYEYLNNIHPTFNNYLENMKKIQKNLLELIENDDKIEEKHQVLIQSLNDLRIEQNKYFLKSFLYLISKVSNNHQQLYNLDEKMEKIF